MIKNFLIINCTGNNNSIGLKFDNKFFKKKLQSNIKSNNLLISNIISFIKKHKVKLSNKTLPEGNNLKHNSQELILKDIFLGLIISSADQDLRDEAIPLLKGFTIEVLTKQLSKNMLTSLHSYIYNYGKSEITIIWENEGLNEIGRRFDNKEVVIRIDERYYRPTEVEELLGDATKAEKKLGWKPKITLEQLISEMVSEEKKILS